MPPPLAPIVAVKTVSVTPTIKAMADLFVINAPLKARFNAVQAVAGVLGMGQPVNAPTPIKPPVSVSKPIQDKQARLASLLAQTALIDDSSPIKRYLQQRGLDWQRIASHTNPLRFHAAIPYWTPNTQSKPLHLGR